MSVGSAWGLLDLDKGDWIFLLNTIGRVVPGATGDDTEELTDLLLAPLRSGQIEATIINEQTGVEDRIPRHHWNSATVPETMRSGYAVVRMTDGPPPIDRTGPVYISLAALMACAGQSNASDKPLIARERNTLLKLVLGMAEDKFNFRPTDGRGPAARNISAALARVGYSVSEDTVLKYLKEAVGADLKDPGT